MIDSFRNNQAERQTLGRANISMNVTALHTQHGERIRRFCFRLCGRWEDAEDLAQDVFVAACQGASGFQGRAAVTTWLYRIALIQWRNRQRRPAVQTISWDHVGETAASHADPAQHVPQDLALARALAALPEDLYETFLLVRVEGLKYREAAQALDVPQGTVQWRVHEATRRLRALLQEEEDNDL